MHETAPPMRLRQPVSIGVTLRTAPASKTFRSWLFGIVAVRDRTALFSLRAGVTGLPSRSESWAGARPTLLGTAHSRSTRFTVLPPRIEAANARCGHGAEVPVFRLSSGKARGSRRKGSGKAYRPGMRPDGPKYCTLMIRVRGEHVRHCDAPSRRSACFSTGPCR